MSRIKQNARVLEAAMRGAFADRLPGPTPQEIFHAYRHEWAALHKCGLANIVRMPPLNGAQMEAVMKESSDFYWTAGFVPYGEHKRFRDDARNAALAANAEWAAKNRKRGKGAELRRVLLERDGSDCWVCGHEMGDNVTIEHKRALANGGDWSFDNLALAHTECNRALGRLPEAAKEAARGAIKAELEAKP